ncbi:MAG: hypothetical protein UT84_C0029G0001, partial [Candidatus Curtissbacteria bacterium GW2011_GWA1_40_16]
MYLVSEYKVNKTRAIFAKIQQQWVKSTQELETAALLR